ncbi:MAG: hypothetical protein HY769_04460 [Candidatus Stahlbacteria bacterium]|nr:hypothetical protein [Candidatus Stahlbacteria bacterium]
MYKSKLFFVGVSIFCSGMAFAEVTINRDDPYLREKSIGRELLLDSNKVETVGITDWQITIIPKDPLIAGLMSILSPGLGQIYCQKYVRGVAFLGGEIGCFVLASTIAGVRNKEYTYIVTDEAGIDHKLTRSETISNWADLTELEKGCVVGLILSGVGVHIWNIIDAYYLAQKHNREHLGWLMNIDMQLGYGTSRPGGDRETNPSLGIGITTSF